VAPTAAVNVWTTIGGDGSFGFADGDVATSKFNLPYGLALDTDGNVYVADIENHRIRKFTTATSTWSTIGGSGTAGSVDGDIATSRFKYPYGVAVGADDNVYVADTLSHNIRKFTASTSTWSTIGGGSATGFANGDMTTSRFAAPNDVAVGANGNVYVADRNNHRIRMYTASTTMWSTIGGDGSQAFANGDVATSRFSNPKGVAVDAVGNVYVADGDNCRIRK